MYLVHLRVKCPASVSIPGVIRTAVDDQNMGVLFGVEDVPVILRKKKEVAQPGGRKYWQINTNPDGSQQIQ